MAINDLGTVRPGSTIYVPFATYDSNDPSASVTLTGLTTADILIYKNGSVTQRASTTGFTLLDTDGIDFDSVTGIHGFSVDLSSNATAGFYTAGARYFIVLGDVSVDSGTVRAVIATFKIGYEGAILDTTIATLASQTSFTLTAGSADNSAYVGCPVIVHDVASAVQVAIGYVSAYTGSTKTVTLAADPGIFTMAAGDNISLFMPSNVAAIAGSVTSATNVGTAGTNYSATRGLSGTALPAAAADAAGGIPISDAGGLDLDTMNTNVSSILTDTAEIGTAGAGLTNINLPDQTMNITGNITGNLSGSVGSVTGNVGGNVAGSVASVTGDINTAAGTITTLDGLDTAQDSQHATTLSKLLKYFQLALRKDAAIATDNATELTAINADGGSGAGAFANTTDAQEALRDWIGDGTNLTEAGGDGDHLTEAGGTGDQLTALATQASVDGLNDLSAAEVNAEVVDALATDTYAEPGQGAPAATASLVAKIGNLHKAWRNKSDQTSTLYQLYNDDASTVDAKATVSDDGSTFTRGEIASGP